MPAVIVTCAAKAFGAQTPQRGHVQEQVVARLFQDRVETLQGETEDFGQVVQFVGGAGNVFGMMALCACGVAAMLPALAPQLAARLVMPQLFAVLVLASGSNCVVQCMAILLRSFKCEPFLMQSIVVASLTLVFSALTVTIWGNVGATFSYFFATSIIGMPYAGAIFVRARRAYLSKIALVLQPEVSG